MIINFSKDYLIEVEGTELSSTSYNLHFIDKDNINPSNVKLLLKNDTGSQNIDLILQNKEWIVPTTTIIPFLGETTVRLILTYNGTNHATNTIKINLEEVVKATSFSMKNTPAMMAVARSATTFATFSASSPATSQIPTPTESLEFVIDGRNIVLSKGVLQDVIVQGDSNSKFITIIINRYFDGIDLSTKVAGIKWMNSQKKGKVDDISSNDIVINTDTLEITWTPDATTTAENGTLKFVVQFTDAADDYIWQTKISSIEVQDGLIISQYATVYDYTTEKAWLTANPTSAVYNMVDGNPSIKITNRDIIIPKDFRFVCKGDNESEIVTFVMDRYYEGIDLSTKTVTIKYINANGEGDRVIACNVSYDVDFIYFGWLVTNTATVESGKIKFSIELLDYDVATDIFFAWNTHPAELTVEEGLIVDKDIMANNASFIQQASVALNNIAIYGATKAEVTDTVDEMIDILSGGTTSGGVTS